MTKKKNCRKKMLKRYKDRRNVSRRGVKIISGFSHHRRARDYATVKNP